VQQLQQQLQDQVQRQFQQQFQQQFPNQGGVQPGTPGVPGGASNAAIGLINQLLTTPRQPPPGAVPAPTANLTAGGLGIAGVASTHTGPTIKVYGERQKFNEWEFVFELQQGLAAQVPGQQQNQGQNPNQQQQANPLGTNPTGSNPAGFSPFGASPAGTNPGMPNLLGPNSTGAPNPGAAKPVFPGGR
jgi:hypothetical protein